MATLLQLSSSISSIYRTQYQKQNVPEIASLCIGVVVVGPFLLHSIRISTLPTRSLSSSSIYTRNDIIEGHPAEQKSTRKKWGAKYHLTIYLLHDYYLMACKNV